jgi:hypothetical protein
LTLSKKILELNNAGANQRTLTDLVCLSPNLLTEPVYSGRDADISGTIQLEQSNGQVIISQTPMKAFEMRYFHSAKHFMNTFASDIPIYQISMSETPAVGIIKGAVDGYVTFKGNEYIKIVPGTKFNNNTSLAVDVKVVAWRVQHLCLKDRRADVIR